MSNVVAFQEVQLESCIDLLGNVHLGAIMRKRVLKEMARCEAKQGSFGPDFYAIARPVLEEEGYVERHDVFKLQTGMDAYRLTSKGKAEADV